MTGRKHENAVPSGEAGGLTMRKVPVAGAPTIRRRASSAT